MSNEERHKWDLAHRERGFFPAEPSSRLSACKAYLPRHGGRALDLAGGSGRHAFWLAEQGFSVTLVDISAVALEIAEERAASRAIHITTLCADLGQDPFPAGPWDIILCFHYLHRALFAEFANQLAPDGILMFVQPTVRNLERHSRPSARFLLAEGELPQLAAQHKLEILHHEEGWSASGRHEAHLIAKPARIS